LKIPDLLALPGSAIDVAILDRDEHGYPRMNTDEGFLLREANPHYPCPSSFACPCHPVFPLAALPLASISQGLTGMNTDIHG
jgi:hypothetical protein